MNECLDLDGSLDLFHNSVDKLFDLLKNGINDSPDRLYGSLKQFDDSLNKLSSSVDRLSGLLRNQTFSSAPSRINSSLDRLCETLTWVDKAPELDGLRDSLSRVYDPPKMERFNSLLDRMNDSMDKLRNSQHRLCDVLDLLNRRMRDLHNQELERMRRQKRLYYEQSYQPSHRRIKEQPECDDSHLLCFVLALAIL